MTNGSQRPNVVLIHCHDLGRFLACYGVPTVQTPSLDALAADGIQFDRSFCTAPQCSPSRAALFTGRYPHSTGVLGLTHGSYAWDMRQDERHVASLLSDLGYWTELVGVHHESRTRPDTQVAEQLGFDRVATGGRAEEVADQAIAALTTRTDDPERSFYLQVGFFEPHRLSPPTEGGTRRGFVGDYIEPDRSLGVSVPGYLRDDSSTRDEIAELQGAVSYMDAAVGRILAAIDALGLTESTIVVFTTDHGLALPRAKCTLYDAGLETALIMRAPCLGWTGGRVVDDLVSNVDVVPTLLETVGASLPESLHGHSVLPTLTESVARHREYVFGELTFHNYFDPRRCVRTLTHKLIVNFDSVPAQTVGVSQSWRPWSTPTPPTSGLEGAQQDPVELYDLRDDPLETTNMADSPEYGLVLGELGGQLRRWMQETDDPLLTGPIPSPAFYRAHQALRHLTMANDSRHLTAESRNPV